MLKPSTLILIAFSLLSSPSLIAKDALSSADQKALRKTQRMLKNKQQRNKAINESKDAQRSHKSAIKAVGDENTDELYGVSSIALEDIVKQTNGDPIAMQELLNKAQEDPEAFYNSLSPETRAAIKTLKTKVKKPAH